MADVAAIVFERFTNIYGEPKHTPNPEAFFEEYERALSGYSDALLRRAIDLVIAEHAFTTWPTIGKICKAIEKAAPPPAPLSTFKDDVTMAPPSPIAKENVQRLVDQVKADFSLREAAKTPAERMAKYPTRDDWQRMIDETPNAGLHGLTERSRRMMGDE
ncbi:MAG: hypothetical protein RLZ60_1186 [Pseudomonadota bacterium]